MFYFLFQGIDMDPGIPTNPAIKFDPWTIVGICIGIAVLVASVFFVMRYSYENRWYIQYQIAKHKIMKQPLHTPDQSLGGMHNYLTFYKKKHLKTC